MHQQATNDHQHDTNTPHRQDINVRKQNATRHTPRQQASTYHQPPFHQSPSHQPTNSQYQTSQTQAQNQGRNLPYQQQRGTPILTEQQLKIERAAIEKDQKNMNRLNKEVERKNNEIKSKLMQIEAFQMSQTQLENKVKQMTQLIDMYERKAKLSNNEMTNPGKCHSNENNSHNDNKINNSSHVCHGGPTQCYQHANNHNGCRNGTHVTREDSGQSHITKLNHEETNYNHKCSKIDNAMNHTPDIHEMNNSGNYHCQRNSIYTDNKANNNRRCYNDGGLTEYSHHPHNQDGFRAKVHTPCEESGQKHISKHIYDGTNCNHRCTEMKNAMDHAPITHNYEYANTNPMSGSIPQTECEPQASQTYIDPKPLNGTQTTTHVYEHQEYDAKIRPTEIKYTANNRSSEMNYEYNASIINTIKNNQELIGTNQDNVTKLLDAVVIMLQTVTDINDDNKQKVKCSCGNDDTNHPINEHKEENVNGYEDVDEHDYGNYEDIIFVREENLIHINSENKDMHDKATQAELIHKENHILCMKENNDKTHINKSTPCYALTQTDFTLNTNDRLIKPNTNKDDVAHSTATQTEMNHVSKQKVKYSMMNTNNLLSSLNYAMIIIGMIFISLFIHDWKTWIIIGTYTVILITGELTRFKQKINNIPQLKYKDESEIKNSLNTLKSKSNFINGVEPTRLNEIQHINGKIPQSTSDTHGLNNMVKNACNDEYSDRNDINNNRVSIHNSTDTQVAGPKQNSTSNVSQYLCSRLNINDTDLDSNDTNMHDYHTEPSMQKESSLQNKSQIQEDTVYSTDAANKLTTTYMEQSTDTVDHVIYVEHNVNSNVTDDQTISTNLSTTNRTENHDEEINNTSTKHDVNTVTTGYCNITTQKEMTYQPCTQVENPNLMSKHNDCNSL